MHPEDLTWFSEMREILRDAGYDPDEIRVDEVNGIVDFRWEIEEDE